LAMMFPLKQILCVTPKVVASFGNHWNWKEGWPVLLGWDLHPESPGPQGLSALQNVMRKSLKRVRP